MTRISQRLTQTSDFWNTQFQISQEAIEGLYNTIIETGEPLSIEAVGLFFVRYTFEDEARRMRSEMKQGKPYSPDRDYSVGDQVIFPNYDYAVGTVANTRSGYNPMQGDFTVLEVVFEEYNTLSAEFAASLKMPHALLEMDEDGASGDDELQVQKAFQRFQHHILSRVTLALEEADEFVRFSNQWFLQGLLVEVQEGLLNIVDAAIDINGSPLNADTLIGQIDLQGDGEITESTRFSVNYRLEQDDRFKNVGTEDQVLWYLDRLMPKEIKTLPFQLVFSDDNFDISLFDNEQRALLAEIGDEATPIEYTKPFDPDASSITLILNNHHQRLGTLPVFPSLQAMLPDANGRIMALHLVDGRTGDEMLSWYISQYNYIYGLADWYGKYKLPIGAMVTLTKTDSPTRMVIDYVPQRPQVEHIRVAFVKNGQLSFEERKRRLMCKYDELMVVEEEDVEKIDLLRKQVIDQDQSLDALLAHILPELMRFTSQGTVHIKTIYSAINILKRCSPGLLMETMIKNDSFVSMGHGYWTYRPAKD